MTKKGIDELGTNTLKYKKITLEYFVNDSRLYFITSSLDFEPIIKLIRAGEAVYLNHRTIRCCVGSILHTVSVDESVKKIKKQLVSMLKKFIDTRIINDSCYYFYEDKKK